MTPTVHVKIAQWGYGSDFYRKVVIIGDAPSNRLNGPPSFEINAK